MGEPRNCLEREHRKYSLCSAGGRRLVAGEAHKLSYPNLHKGQRQLAIDFVVVGRGLRKGTKREATIADLVTKGLRPKYGSCPCTDLHSSLVLEASMVPCQIAAVEMDCRKRCRVVC